jgi:uncharacterized protein (TIGR02271 family)
MTSAHHTQIQTGWDVYGSDGDKIGEVAEVADDHFIIEKGFLFTTDIHVPLSAIASTAEDRVQLALTKDQVENEDWTSIAGGTRGVDTYDTADTDVSRDRGTHATAGTERDTIERREERLTVDKDKQQAGSVRVDKHVEEDRQAVDVPVTKEEVHLERHAVDRPADGGTLAEDSIDVPVYEERVKTGKEARVVEELEVEKTAHTDTARVEDTVRREEFDIDDDAGTTRRDR